MRNCPDVEYFKGSQRATANGPICDDVQICENFVKMWLREAEADHFRSAFLMYFLIKNIYMHTYSVCFT